MDLMQKAWVCVGALYMDPNICGLFSRTRAIESHYIRYCIRLKLGGWVAGAEGWVWSGGRVSWGLGFRVFRVLGSRAFRA